MNKVNGHKKTPSVRAQGVSGNVINDQENNVMANNSTNVIPFNFGKQQVRTLLINDQPWFVANDVSAALQYSEASAMTRHLDDDEKGLSIVQTLGGDQEMLVINESGLYSAILRSRKAEAKRFKKWVTAEVLPAIRKHGSYEDTQGVMAPMVDELLGKVGAMRLSNVMRCRVAKLDAEHQRSATAKLASALHARFDVPRMELIPADQMDAACNFIASYAIEGEYLPKGGNQSVDIPTDLSENQRYLVFTDGSGKRQVQPIPFDACVMSPTQFLAAFTGSNGVHVPPAVLFDFALAAMQKVKWRMAA
ncbi:MULTISPECIES: Bro-N domain-containing protein [unclassified Pseudomonas]|uniref:BRO-N domain-containing protein n=1 Tax=unclassified Pseudomonas TaxID=196821 RepID=UPI001F5A129A|nr:MULTISPECIES: Bro-N domain-containing protein [unclassified Pseudomonas]